MSDVAIGVAITGSATAVGELLQLQPSEIRNKAMRDCARYGFTFMEFGTDTAAVNALAAYRTFARFLELPLTFDICEQSLADTFPLVESYYSAQ